MRPWWFAILVVATAGCAVGIAPDKETDPPVITIDQPARGLVMDGIAGDVVVRGTALDEGSGISSVTVNGVEAELERDGSFIVNVPTPIGLTLLHTVAVDGWDNEAIDTRSVLRGEFVPQDTPVEQGVVVRVNDKTLGTLGTIVGNTVAGVDFTAMGQQASPILDEGTTCLEVQVGVQSISLTGVGVQLAPVDGGIAFNVRVTDLAVNMEADYEVLCIGGSNDVSITADSITLDGSVQLAVVGGAPQAGMKTLDADFDNFQFDISGIPSELESLLGSIDDKVAELIVEQVRPILEAEIQDFADQGFATELDVFGSPLAIGLGLSGSEFSPSGGTLALDSVATFTGLQTVGYLASPAPVPPLPSAEGPGDGFRLGIADDLLNQVLGALHGAGALEASLSFNSADFGLGDAFDTISVDALSPPVVSVEPGGPALAVTVGDLLVGLEYEGNEVGRLAISAEIGLDVDVLADGTLQMRATVPQSFVDVDYISPDSELPASALAAIGNLAVTQIGSLVDDSVGTIELPAFEGTTLTNLSVSAELGYTMVGGNLEAN